jgi:hypothetical protein
VCGDIVHEALPVLARIKIWWKTRRVPRLPPKPRLRRRLIIPIWRVSGASLWTLLVILKIFDTIEMSQRFLLDAGGLLFGFAAAIDLVKWWKH